jgi:hypothetical protein
VLSSVSLHDKIKQCPSLAIWEDDVVVVSEGPPTSIEWDFLLFWVASINHLDHIRRVKEI